VCMPLVKNHVLGIVGRAFRLLYVGRSPQWFKTHSGDDVLQAHDGAAIYMSGCLAPERWRWLP
jgi:hypothetical protein